jgi:2'-5' RNA ligase
MRLFVAVDLSDKARQAMAAEQKRIGAALHGAATSLKWVRPEHAHLTLVFLGHVDVARVPAVVDAIGRDVDAPAFEMVLAGAGAFPPRGAPRVLWIGIGGGSAQLLDVQRELAGRLVALGIPLEDRPFHPHLTIARWRQSRATDRLRALEAASSGEIARVRVEFATLYESRPSPSGPSYGALTRATLRPR